MSGTYEYPAEVVLERAAQQRLIAGRITHVRDICQKAIERDQGMFPGNPNAQSDRHWLAQSVINILDGLIDDQIRRELT